MKLGAALGPVGTLVALALAVVPALVPTRSADARAPSRGPDAGHSERLSFDAASPAAGGPSHPTDGLEHIDDAGAASRAALTPPTSLPGEKRWSGICTEHVPEGAAVPVITEDMAARGTSGYAVTLRLVIQHGQGETVLPEGFKLQPSSDAAKALQHAGFVIPDPAGGMRPEMVVEPRKATTQTTVTIPFVPLPPKAGRNAMVLPPLPIAVARANNEYLTLCTKPHGIVVEDPIANELHPKVALNPPPRRQLVDWPAARLVALALPLAALIAVLGALGYSWWSKRPKFIREAPRIPPWEVAIGELLAIRRSELIEKGKTEEYVDRVNEVIRRYLGARYGFEAMAEGYNGLETTTGEMLALLDRVRPTVAELPRIRVFLEDCDLVKFARLIPGANDCAEALDRGEKIVRNTIPAMKPPPPDDLRPSAHGVASP
jgi:hypothetical protein